MQLIQKNKSISKLFLLIHNQFLSKLILLIHNYLLSEQMKNYVLSICDTKFKKKKILEFYIRQFSHFQVFTW